MCQFWRKILEDTRRYYSISISKPVYARYALRTEMNSYRIIDVDLFYLSLPNQLPHVWNSAVYYYSYSHSLPREPSGRATGYLSFFCCCCYSSIDRTGSKLRGGGGLPPFRQKKEDPPPFSLKAWLGRRAGESRAGRQCS
jgi:hypothetical protein